MMNGKECYVGFPPLPDPQELIHALVNDPPERRWRLVRDLFRVADKGDVEELIESLQQRIYEAQDFRIRNRITIALQALHHKGEPSNYVIVRGRGAFQVGESGSQPHSGDPTSFAQSTPNFAPVVDFHIHPKMPDYRFLGDMRDAGVTRAVILATDTDPSDLDRPEIFDRLRKDYSTCAQVHRLPFDKIAAQIRASLYSASHVTNQDVADWVEDYPEAFVGFGSVNLSKDRLYVEQKIEEIHRLKLRGVKLLPYSQFFDPSENEHMDLLFDYCRQTRSIVLSHTGCGAGPFEILELSKNSRPGLWEPVVKKYPDVPLVLAHCGAYSSFVPGIWLYEALQLGKKYKNVFADLAAVEWLLDREIVVKEIRKTIGFDRILFGTDYPLPLSAGVNLNYLVSGLKANLHLTEREKRKVLGENATKLLQLG